MFDGGLGFRDIGIFNKALLSIKIHECEGQPLEKGDLH